MADTYRTFTGFVKWRPKDAEAAGKDIRSFVLRANGVKDQALDIRATLWPSHEHVELEAGDAVLVEGKFSVNKGKNKEGDPVTYHNLSVSRILVLGKGDAGADRETTADDTDDDDEAY